MLFMLIHSWIKCSAVTLGRFLPRQRMSTDFPITECQTIGQVTQQLL